MIYGKEELKIQFKNTINIYLVIEGNNNIGNYSAVWEIRGGDHLNCLLKRSRDYFYNEDRNRVYMSVISKAILQTIQVWSGDFEETLIRVHHNYVNFQSMIDNKSWNYWKFKADWGIEKSRYWHSPVDNQDLLIPILFMAESSDIQVVPINMKSPLVKRLKKEAIINYDKSFRIQKPEPIPLYKNSPKRKYPRDLMYYRRREVLRLAEKKAQESLQKGEIKKLIDNKLKKINEKE